MSTENNIWVIENPYKRIDLSFLKSNILLEKQYSKKGDRPPLTAKQKKQKKVKNKIEKKARKKSRK